MDETSLRQLLVAFSEPASAASQATQACFLGLLSPQFPLRFSSSRVVTRSASSALVHEVFVDAALEELSLVSFLGMATSEVQWRARYD